MPLGLKWRRSVEIFPDVECFREVWGGPFVRSADISTGIYSATRGTWVASLNLTWTLFDGWARENRLAQAKANQKQAAASVDSIRDELENQVWSAYSTARTALRQQRAAAALLEAATESYNAALESYNFGLRSQIDVVSAQQTLADARTADVNARTQLLTALAGLAYQTGDLLFAKTTHETEITNVYCISSVGDRMLPGAFH